MAFKRDEDCRSEEEAFCLESSQKRLIAVTLIKYSLALALVFLRSKIKLLDYFNDACE